MKWHAWLSSFLLAGVLSADAPTYFMATAAGYIPAATPIATQQNLVQPAFVAYDQWGILYYATAHQVWRLNPDWTASLIAGNGTNDPSNLGDRGPATAASLSWVCGIALDDQQNLYISDLGAYEIRKVNPAGIITRFAGTGATPLYGAQSAAANGSAALKVALNPGPLAVDSTYLYVSDSATSSVLAFTLDGKSSKVVAGNHGALSAGDGGPASGSSLYYPSTLALAGSILYIEEGGGARIRQVDFRTNRISTRVELSTSYLLNNQGLAADSDGTLYVQLGKIINRLYPSTTALQRWAGGGIANPGDPGPGLQASLVTPASLAINPATHDLALADFDANLVQVVSAGTGAIQTVAGIVHFAGDGGPAPLALFNGLEAIVSDSQGNLYVADVGNDRVRKIDSSGIVTTIAGTGAASFYGDHGPAISATLNLRHSTQFASNLAIDPSGNLYFSDYGNGRIRKIDTSGVITTVAGGGKSPIGPGVIATSAAILPGPIAVNSHGDIYFGNVQTGTGPAVIPTIYKIDSAGHLSVAAGGAGKVSDSGPALSTPIGYAYCLTMDALDNLYICDSAYSRVRQITPDGFMTTVAGNGNAPNGAIQSGTPTATAIGSPTSLAVDSKGHLLISSLRQVTQIDDTGTLQPVAGINAVPAASTGDGDYSSQATFTSIGGMTADALGNLYFTDGGIYVRQAMPFGANGPPPIISSGGIVGAGASNPPVESVSPGAIVSIFGANFFPAGTQHLLQAGDLLSGKIPTNLGGICVSFGGVNAPITGVFPNQINVQVPVLPPGPVTVKVTSNCGGNNPVVGNVSAVSVDTASPEFFSTPDPASGSAVVASNVNGGPITAGSIVEAYGTGWGATSPSIAPGAVPGMAAQLVESPTLLLGGVPVAADNILYAGVSPCCAGLYQLDFTVPPDTPPGNLSLVISVDGISSPANAHITVH